ncbi:MAG: hypothetical protein GXY74_11430 [Phycisphaerae bacterium]|nr:hypothetical protein [Phycisphaerae bacterium]
MVAANRSSARRNLVRFYDDGPGGPGATREKKQAFREGFLEGARRVARVWAHPPEEPRPRGEFKVVRLSEMIKKMPFDSSAEIEAVRKLREQIHEGYTVYSRGSAGPKTYHLGYRPGHEVPAARARGHHHALEHVIEPWRDLATSDVDIYDPRLLKPWLAVVEQWAESPMRPEAPMPPPRVMEVAAATAFERRETHLIPVTTRLTEPALACPVCGFEYVHPVAVECCPSGPRGHVRIDAEGVRLEPVSAPEGRGVAVTLGFLCENGHLFTYRLSVHKGQTFLERTMGNAPRDADEWPRTIWRD